MPTLRIKRYFFFAKIPVFSRKMLSFAYISANPPCQMSTDHGSGFQGTQIRGTRLQNRELGTFPICHFLKIYTLSSGSIRRARPQSWLWDKSGMRALGGNNGIFAGLVEQQNFWVPGRGATGTDGHRRSSSGAVAACPVSAGVTNPTSVPKSMSLLALSRDGKSISATSQVLLWSLAVLRCSCGAGGDELWPLSRCPCQGTSKECSFALVEIPQGAAE